MRDPLLPPLAALAAGILVSRFAACEPCELILAIAACAALCILAMLRRARVLAGACCLLGFFFAGALVDLAHRPGPRPELDAEGREPVILSGCVVQPPALSGDKERFVVELEPGARVQVTAYGREGQAPPALRYGQRVEFEARVRRPRNFGNPGAFDYARFLARRDIYWTASMSTGAEVTILGGECGSRFQAAITHLRVLALERLARLYEGKPYETGMMQAVMIGETYQVQRVWTELFRNTGTYHTLVISGTHTAALAAFLLLLLRIGFVRREFALLITSCLLWLYALVTGWGSPCVRCAAGFTLFAIAACFARRRRVVNILSAIAMVFLVLDPEQMFEASFQLTFLAVGFIGVFAAPLLERVCYPRLNALADLPDTGRDMHLAPFAAQFRVEMRLLAETIRRWTKLPERASCLAGTIPARVLLYGFQLAAISAIVQLGLALPMVVYFHRVGFSGVSANAIVVPLMCAVIPIGFMAIFTGWNWMAGLAGWLLSASHAAVSWHMRMEPHWRVPDPPLWLGVAIAAGFIFAALALHARRTWFVGAASVCGVLLAILLWHPFAPHIAAHALEMTAIDVGQGDSILLTLPDGKLMLVDGGGVPTFGHRAPSQMDIGEEVVSPYLWARSIGHIDIVAATHAHADHIGGLPALLENFHARELWTGANSDNPVWGALRDRAQESGVRIVPMHRGQCFDYGGAHFEVLAPALDYEPKDTPHNNDSLAFRIAFGRHSFLLSGDIERPIESDLAAQGLLRPTDVLKVPHHGSHTSSTAAFLDLLHPSVALISAGFENSYGHPHQDVLDRYAERNIRVFRTDLDGYLTVRSDGRRLSFDMGRWSGDLGSADGGLRPRLF